MSEIKGQLLGMVLVLSIFGAIGAGLKTVFTEMEGKVEDAVTSATEGITEKTDLLHY